MILPLSVVMHEALYQLAVVSGGCFEITTVICAEGLHFSAFAIQLAVVGGVILCGCF